MAAQEIIRRAVVSLILAGTSCGERRVPPYVTTTQTPIIAPEMPLTTILLQGPITKPTETVISTEFASPTRLFPTPTITTAVFTPDRLKFLDKEEISSPVLTITLLKEGEVTGVSFPLFVPDDKLLSLEKAFGLPPQTIFAGEGGQLYRLAFSPELDTVISVPIYEGEGSVQTLAHAPQRKIWRFSEGPRAGPFCWAIAPVGGDKILAYERVGPRHMRLVFNGGDFNEWVRETWRIKKDWLKRIIPPIFWLAKGPEGYSIVFGAETLDGKVIFRQQIIPPEFKTAHLPGVPEQSNFCNEKRMREIANHAKTHPPEILGIMLEEPEVIR